MEKKTSHRRFNFMSSNSADFNSAGISPSLDRNSLLNKVNEQLNAKISRNSRLYEVVVTYKNEQGEQIRSSGGRFSSIQKCQDSFAREFKKSGGDKFTEPLVTAEITFKAVFLTVLSLPLIAVRKVIDACSRLFNHVRSTNSTPLNNPNSVTQAKKNPSTLNQGSISGNESPALNAFQQNLNSMIKKPVNADLGINETCLVDLTRASIFVKNNSTTPLPLPREEEGGKAAYDAIKAEFGENTAKNLTQLCNQSYLATPTKRLNEFYSGESLLGSLTHKNLTDRQKESLSAPLAALNLFIASDENNIVITYEV